MVDVNRWLHRAGKRRVTLGLVMASGILLLSILIQTRQTDVSTMPLETEPVDPLATDFFVMNNAEIREDLLEQLTIHGVEFWINEDDTVGFYVRDTREVDRIANEAINVWITSQ